MMGFNKSGFIDKYVTKRSSSLFAEDVIGNKDHLNKALNGKAILVIGGAGTIGSSFINAILPFKPSKLTVVDLNENGLTELVRDLRSDAEIMTPEEVITYPIDFGSDIFLRWFEKQDTFDVIANFAALKHVRSEKDELSIEAMIHNNVIKNYRFLESMRKNRPGRLFCVSTDKAANPANVMGATKKLMEQLLIAYSSEFHITTARFANVAFSNGSLPDGFLNRLAKGQPLTAPKDITRYFVSPKESGQLCLLACMLGHSGDIFFPKVNTSYHEQTFTAIAEELLTQLGYSVMYCVDAESAKQMAKTRKPNQKEYPVYFFNSDTSGEKKIEEFFTGDEIVDLNRFESVGTVQYKMKPNKQEVIEFLANLDSDMSEGKLTKSEIVKRLKSMIPGFMHIEKGKNLDQSM